MKKILITGCAGLFGANLSRRLLEKGYEVIGIDDLSGGYSDFLPEHSNFKFIEGDLETYDMDGLFDSFKPHVVFHFAAYAAEGLSPFIREFNYRNNLIASTRVVNQCIKHSAKLVFASSIAVYGDQELPYTEDMNPAPEDPYGIAKYAVEMDIKQAGEQFGLKYTIVRPHNVLGIYQNIWDMYRNVIGIFIRKILKGEPLIIYGDGEQTRSFSDISYCLNAFEKLIDGHDGETFNIGADKEYSLNEVTELVKTIASKYGYRTKITYGEERHEVKHAICDHTKAKESLEFVDDTNLESLIEQMFLWAKDQPERPSEKMEYEIEEGMYSYWK